MKPRRRLGSAHPKATAVQRLDHATKDPDFNGVRGEEALSKLPAAEATAWRALWQQVTESLANKRGGK